MISINAKDSEILIKIIEITYKHNGIDHYAKYLDLKNDTIKSKILAKLENIEGN